MRTWSKTLTLFTLITSFAFADEVDDTGHYDSSHIDPSDEMIYAPSDAVPLGTGEKQVSFYDKEEEKKPPQPKTPPPPPKKIHQITPADGPKPGSDADFFLQADLLVWNVKEDGMQYAFTNFGTAATDAPSRGKYQSVDFPWFVGFRAGLGVVFNPDGWDANAMYTFFRNAGNNSVDSANLYPLWNIANNYNSPQQSSTLANSITSAGASWRIAINAIDLELGRRYYISEKLRLRPFIGLKGVWNKQNYQVTYVRPNGGIQNRDDMTNDVKYWGLGGRSGLDTSWTFYGQGLSVFGDFALTALWNHFSNTRVDTTIALPSANNTQSTIINTSAKYWALLPVIEMDIGLRYEREFGEAKYRAMAQIGWETQYWYEYNQLTRLMGEQSYADLIIGGAVIRGRFDF